MSEGSEAKQPRWWKAWTFRPRQLGRVLWLPHLYGFALGLLAAWGLPLLLPGLNPGARLRISGGILQLGGIVVVIDGLVRRGVVFKRLDPLQAARRVLRGVRSAFRPVRSGSGTGTITGGGSMTGTGSAAESLTVGPLSLEQRVEALERRAEDAEKAMKELGRKHREDIQTLARETGEIRRHASQELKAFKDQVETGLVDGTPWEWVGVSWILLGILAALVAEFL